MVDTEDTHSNPSPAVKILSQTTMADVPHKAEESSHPHATKKGKCLKNFCDSSTIHGLSAISRSRTKFLKLLWTISFISACGLCIWQVVELIKKLSGHEITTTTTSTMQPEIDFPILTICNSNPYSESKIEKKIGPLIKSFEKSYKDIAFNTRIAKYFGNMQQDQLRNFSEDIDIFGMAKLNNSCLFAGRKCRDIRSAATSFLGTCIVFNSNSTFKQIRPGPDFGFSASFNINEEDYSRLSVFQDAGPGILVRVGTNYGMDYREFKNSAILASPGMTTQIKLKKKMKIRLPSPYKDKCTDAYSVESLHGLVFKNPPSYTVAWCEVACLVKWQMKICGYVSPYFSSMIKFRVDTDRSNVSVSNKTGNDDLEREYKCIERATASFFHSENRTCKCSPLCSETEHDFTISSLRWPSSAQADILLKKIKRSWSNDSSFRNWTKKRIYENIVRIEVFYHDFQLLLVEQKQAYDIVRFLSDLGGQAGLWIGASVYSLFELVSFLLSSFVKPFITDKWRKRSVANEN